MGCYGVAWLPSQSSRFCSSLTQHDSIFYVIRLQRLRHVTTPVALLKRFFFWYSISRRGNVPERIRDNS